MDGQNPPRPVRRQSIKSIDSFALDEKINQKRLRHEQRKAEKQEVVDAVKLAAAKALENKQQQEAREKEQGRLCATTLLEFQDELAANIDQMARAESTTSRKWMSFPRNMPFYHKFLARLFDPNMWIDPHGCEMMTFLLLSFLPCDCDYQFQMRLEKHHRIPIVLRDREHRRGMNGIGEKFSPAQVPESVKAQQGRVKELFDSSYSFRSFLLKIPHFSEVPPQSYQVEYYELVEAVVDLVVADALVVVLAQFSGSNLPEKLRVFLVEVLFHMLEVRPCFGLDRRLYEMLTGETRRQWIFIAENVSKYGVMWDLIVSTFKAMVHIDNTSATMKASTFVQYANVFRAFTMINDEKLLEFFVMCRRLLKKYSSKSSALLLIFEIMQNAVHQCDHYRSFSSAVSSEQQKLVWKELDELWLWAFHSLRNDTSPAADDYIPLQALCVSILARTPYTAWTRRIEMTIEALAAHVDSSEPHARLVSLQGLLLLLRGVYKPRTKIPGWDYEWLRALCESRVRARARASDLDVGCEMLPPSRVNRNSGEDARASSSDAAETSSDVIDVERMVMQVYTHWLGGSGLSRDPVVLQFVMREEDEPVKFMSRLRRILNHVLMERTGVRLVGEMADEIQIILDVLLQIATNNISLVMDTVLPFLFARVARHQEGAGNLISETEHELRNHLPVHLAMGIEFAQNLVDPAQGFHKFAMQSSFAKRNASVYHQALERLPQRLVKFLQRVMTMCESEIGIEVLPPSPLYTPVKAHDGTPLKFWTWVTQKIAKEVAVATHEGDDNVFDDGDDEENVLERFNELFGMPNQPKRGKFDKREKTFISKSAGDNAMLQARKAQVRAMFTRRGRRALRMHTRKTDLQVMKGLQKVSKENEVPENLERRRISSLVAYSASMDRIDVDKKLQRKERKVHFLVNLLYSGPQSEVKRMLSTLAGGAQVTYLDLHWFWKHHTNNAPRVDAKAELMLEAQHNLNYQILVREKGLLFQLYRSALRGFSVIFPDYLFASVSHGGTVSLLAALVHRNLDIARAASHSLQCLMSTQSSRRVIIYKAFLNILVVPDLQAPAIATLMSNFSRLLEIWIKSLLLVDHSTEGTSHHTDQGDLLQPQELWLGKLEAICLANMCDGHISVRLPAVQLLHSVQGLSDAFNIFKARMQVSLAEDTRDMLQEIKIQRIEAIVSSLTTFRVADLLTDRWQETLQLALVYFKTNHISASTPGLNMDENETKGADIFHLSIVSNNPLWLCIVCAVASQMAAQSTCSSLLHDLRLLLLMRLSGLDPPPMSPRDISRHAGHTYSLWVNLSALLLTICGVREGEEDVSEAEVPQRRANNRTLRQIFRTIRAKIIGVPPTHPNARRELTDPQQRRQWATAVWMALDPTISHSYVQTRLIVRRVLNKTLLDALSSRVPWVQMGVVRICTCAHWHAMGDVVDCILQWYGEKQPHNIAMFERRRVRPLICRIFRTLLDRPGAVLKLKQSKPTLASLLSFLRSSETILLQIDRVEPLKTPFLDDFEYHLDHVMLVELIAAAFASGALRGVFLRGELERKRWLETAANGGDSDVGSMSETDSDADAKRALLKNKGKPKAAKNGQGAETSDNDQNDLESEIEMSQTSAHKSKVVLDEDGDPVTSIKIAKRNGTKTNGTKMNGKRTVVAPTEDNDGSNKGSATTTKSKQKHKDNTKQKRGVAHMFHDLAEHVEFDAAGVIELELTSSRATLAHARAMANKKMVRTAPEDAVNKREDFMLPLSLLLGGGVGQPIVSGQVPQAGRDARLDICEDYYFMLPNCDKIAWPAFERHQTIMSLRQWTTYDQVGKQRLGLLVGKPGEINFDADAEMALKCLMLQSKAERVIRLVMALGPVLPPAKTIPPNIALPWFRDAEARGTLDMMKTVLRFHGKDFLPFALEQSVLGTQRDSFYYLRGSLRHAVERMEFLWHMLQRCPLSQTFMEDHVTALEGALKPDLIPSEDISLLEECFADHAAVFDPLDPRDFFHKENMSKLQSLSSAKRREEMLKFVRVESLFERPLEWWEAKWREELDEYGGIFLYWACMGLTHPSKAFHTECKTIILLLYNTYHGLKPQKMGSMARMSALSVVEFASKFDDFTESVDQLEASDLLFRKYEGPNFAQITAIRKQNPNEFLDDFTVVVEETWYVLQGMWAQTLGNYVCLSRQQDSTWIGEKPEWRNYSVQTRMKIEPGGAQHCHSGVLVRCSGLADKASRGTCYYVGIDLTANKCFLQLWNDNEKTLLETGYISRHNAKASSTLALRYQPFTLTVVVNENTITVSFDDEEVLDFTDSNDSCPTGSIGFASNQTEVKYDSVLVQLETTGEDPNNTLNDLNNTSMITDDVNTVTLEDVQRSARSHTSAHKSENAANNQHGNSDLSSPSLSGSDVDNDKNKNNRKDGSNSSESDDNKHNNGSGSDSDNSKHSKHSKHSNHSKHSKHSSHSKHSNHSNQDNSKANGTTDTENDKHKHRGKKQKQKHKHKHSSQDGDLSASDLDDVQTLSSRDTEGTVSTLSGASISKSEAEATVRMQQDDKQLADDETRRLIEGRRLRQKEALKVMQLEREAKEKARRLQRQLARKRDKKRKRLLQRKLEEKRSRERQQVVTSLQELVANVAAVAPALAPSIFKEVATAFTAFHSHMKRECQLLHLRILVPFSRLIYLVSTDHAADRQAEEEHHSDLYEIDADFVIPPLLSFTCEISEAGMPHVVSIFWKNIVMAFPPISPDAKPHNLSVLDKILQAMWNKAPQNMQRSFQSVRWYFKTLDTSAPPPEE